MKSKRTSNKFTEDWLPIKGISNGCIQTDDNYLITGVKINPKNIFICDKSEQERIVFGLNNFYNTIDYEFWLVIADRPVDLSIYLLKTLIKLTHLWVKTIMLLILNTIFCLKKRIQRLLKNALEIWLWDVQMLVYHLFKLQTMI